MSLETAAQRCFRTMQARHSSPSPDSSSSRAPRSLSVSKHLLECASEGWGALKAWALTTLDPDTKLARDVAVNTAHSALTQVEAELANLEVGTRLALEALQWHVVRVQEGLDSTEVGVSAELVVMHAAQARQSPSLDFPQFPILSPSPPRRCSFPDPKHEYSSTYLYTILSRL